MYTARITREQRLAIIILLDRSGSMAEETTFRGRQMSKADALSFTINMFLDEMIARSRREDGIRDYFDIAILEYSGEGVRSQLSPMGRFVTPSQLAGKGVKIYDVEFERVMPTGNVVVCTHLQHMWIEPKAVGDTPMGAALEQAYILVRNKISGSRTDKNFPPIVFNITDGEASDADHATLAATSEKIRGTATGEGNSLLFNIHLSSRGQSPVIFPHSAEQLPRERYAQLLYSISSTLPECFNKPLTTMFPDIQLPVKAMSHNCSMEDIFSMLQIGTISMLNSR